ncbi:type II toxin-antitoxin system RelE/ParE family toxin [Allochromatium palmeri]|uniref:Type II toxin-antitoxin system RelE/ParE family toxin n=1 Tax=Allochromatium palmeri TaxID=231048 RepID=A0A6N8EEK4_9GAMM|nr:type II toxin-antitoxin system RelE/ParE family toxin [Allochromatium palmeri]MTW21950.1 hypothetical protein [Allochromatium palmeri]
MRRLLVTPAFERTAKKLHRQQKTALDEALRAVASQPELGEAKVGGLTPDGRPARTFLP